MARKKKDFTLDEVKEELSPEKIQERIRQRIVDCKTLKNSAGWAKFLAGLKEKADEISAEVEERAGTLMDDEITVSENRRDRIMAEVFQDIINTLPDHPGSAALKEEMEFRIEVIKHNRLRAPVLMKLNNTGNPAEPGELVNRSKPIYTELDIKRFQYTQVYGSFEQNLDRYIQELETEANAKVGEQKDELETEYEDKKSV